MDKVNEFPRRSNAAALLKIQFKGAIYPDPFEDEETKDAWQRAYEKVEATQFSPYWEKWFEELLGYNGQPARILAKDIFQELAENESADPVAVIAKYLPDSFPDHVLQASLDLPELAPSAESEILQQIDTTDGNLVKFLKETRTGLESEKLGTKLYDAPREISNDWIRFLALYSRTNPAQARQLFERLNSGLGTSIQEAGKEMDEWGGMMGGFSSFDAQHMIQQRLAGILAEFFPEIVVQKLKKAPVVLRNQTQFEEISPINSTAGLTRTRLLNTVE